MYGSLFSYSNTLTLALATDMYQVHSAFLKLKVDFIPDT